MSFRQLKAPLTRSMFLAASKPACSGVASSLLRAPVFAVSHRTLFSLGNSSLKRLEEQANANPSDAALQAQLMKEYHKNQSPDKVKARYESGQFATNEEVTKEYISAMVRLNMFQQVQLSSLGLKQQQQGAAGIPVGIIASGETVETTTHTVTTQAPILAPSPATQPLTSKSMPLSVTLVHTPAQRAWSFVKTAAVVGAVGYTFYLLQGGTEQEEKKSMNFPVGAAHTVVKTVNERFDDVKGVDEAKAELQEVVEYLRNPQRFSKLGAKLPKGILLSGSPGTGKTLLARAIAGEAGVPFFYCSGSSFDELFVGVGSSRIRKLFDDAKAVSPCIIFIDEIDALGAARRYNMSSSSKETTLNQLLTEMDGFQQTEGIIVIGATNLPDALDSALTRPGRFDKQVVVPVPDIKGRKEIVDYYLRRTIAAPDVDPFVLARGTPGFTGADLSNLINLAAIKATIRNQSSVDMKLLEEAKDDIIMGIKRTAIEKNLDELKVTAYHEGGHALVAIYSDGAHPLHKATIIQRGNALGVTVQLPERDEQSFSRKQMMARLAVCMGGRAAEELAFGEQAVTSGASSDLKQATALASNMVKRWGMSDRVGLVYYQDGDSIKNASDTQRAALDDEVKTLLNDSYSRAKTILTQHKHELDLLAKALLEHETLSGDEIKLVIQGKALPSKLVTRPPPSTSSGDQGGGKDTKTAPTPKLEPIARQSV